MVDPSFDFFFSLFSLFSFVCLYLFLTSADEQRDLQLDCSTFRLTYKYFD